MQQEGLTILTLGTLENLDPVTAMEFQKASQAAVYDCNDRPMEEKPREVHLILRYVPVRDSVGNEVVCIGVDLELTVKSNRPAHTRGGKSLTIYDDGRCAFNPLSPHNVQQRTLPIRGDAGDTEDAG